MFIRVIESAEEAKAAKLKAKEDYIHALDNLYEANRIGNADYRACHTSADDWYSLTKVGWRKVEFDVDIDF